MQAKKKNYLVCASTLNEEIMMKDYKQEQLEETYGSVFEEILCEVFNVGDEEELLGSICEGVIYDLRSDSDVERQVARELDQLNEDSASIDDLAELERQAVAYFKDPIKVFTPSDVIETVQAVTGFIQINAGVKFDSNGVPEQIWKSYGQKLVVSVDRLLDPDSILRQLESLGFSITDLVRVVFYGAPLDKIVGSKKYSKGEKKELEKLDEDYPNILLAIPESSYTKSDLSTFEFVERRVKDSIQTGSPVGLDRVTIGHWEMTHARLTELKLEAEEIKYLDKIQRIQASFTKKKQSYIDNFREAKLLVKQLNEGVIKIKDLLDLEGKTLNQILYVCKKDECVIENPTIYFQVDALAKRKMTLENASLVDQNYGCIIQRINAGENVEVHLLTFEELEGVFNILWNSTGLRISKEYKAVYFSLKERFTHLKSVARKRAA
jgi:hypothetical protein